MQVRGYHLNRLNRWEVFQLLYNFLEFAESRTEGLPEAVNNKLKELRAAFDIYDIEIAQQRQIPIEELQKAEIERNFAIRKIYTLVRDYIDYRFDEKKMQAATVLKRIFKKYGTGSTISRMSQDQQTSMIGNLLQEFARPASVESIATLNLTDAVTALTAHNDVFEHEQRVRYTAQAHYVTGVAKKARVNAQNELLAYADVVNAYALVEGEEMFVELKQALNQLVKSYVAQARQRKRKEEG